MIFSKNKKNRDNRILSRSKIATGEIKNKAKAKDTNFFSRFVFSLLTVIFLGVVAYVFLFSGFLEINKVSISGVGELNYNEVLDFTKNIYSGKFLKIIPKNNFLFIHNKKINSDLYDRFKKIGKIETKKIFPNTLEINIKERKSILLWCSAGPCYFIDENGIAYQGSDMDSGEVAGQNLVELSDTSGTPVKIGEKIFDSQSVALVSEIKDRLKNDAGINVNDQFETSSKMAEDFQARTAGGTILFFSLTDDLDRQISKLKTFLEKEIKGEDMEKLEYIDLRAENKVYYKIKEGEIVNGKSQQSQNQDSQAAPNKNKDEGQNKRG
jgi:cell division septal protein FtsQ